MLKFILIFLTLILVALFILLYFRASSSASITEQQLSELMKLGNSQANINLFLEKAQQTQFTEIVFQNRTAGNSEREEIRVLSVHESDRVQAELSKYPRGVFQLGNPLDNPLSYDRRFIQVEYGEQKILKIELRSL